MVIFQQFVALAWQAMFVCAGLFGIGFLIGFHELGHFIFCKIFNVRTPSFSIGMGPRIFKRKIGETEFALSALPLGGYVEIAGADANDPMSQEKDAFTQKPYYQKMLIIAGGIVFNMFFAYVALSVLYFFGMPKIALLNNLSQSTAISHIEPGSPASLSSLQINDTIIAIDNVETKNNNAALSEYLKANPEKSALLKVERNDQTIEIPVTIGKQAVQDQVRGFLGIDFVIPRYTLAESVKKGIQATHTIFMQVAYAFKSIFKKKVASQLGGPLMVISQTIKGAQQGAKVFILLLALISVNLAVLNIIPLPIMDGGQALFYTIEAVLRRPLPENVKMYIHYACWIAILFLAILLSIKDIFTIAGIGR